MFMPWSPSGGFLQKGSWAVMGYAVPQSGRGWGKRLGGYAAGVGFLRGGGDSSGLKQMSLNLPACGPLSVP